MCMFVYMCARACTYTKIQHKYHFGFPICSLLIYSSFPDKFFSSSKNHGMKPASLLAKIAMWGHKVVNPFYQGEMGFLNICLTPKRKTVQNYVSEKPNRFLSDEPEVWNWRHGKMCECSAWRARPVGDFFNRLHLCLGGSSRGPQFAIDCENPRADPGLSVIHLSLLLSLIYLAGLL